MLTKNNTLMCINNTNTTCCQDAPQGCSQILLDIPLYETISLLILYMIAFWGDTMLAVAFTRDTRLQTNTNYFVMSHISSEIGISVIGIVINILVLFKMDLQHLGVETCISFTSPALLFLFASFLSLTAISLDRYLACVKKIHHRVDKTLTKRTICLIWVLSLLACFPWNRVVFSTRENTMLGWIITLCEQPEYGNTSNKTSNVRIAIFFIFGVIPTLVLLYTCLHVLRVALKNRKRVVDLGNKANKLLADSYTRSAITILLIAGINIICVIPGVVLAIEKRGMSPTQRLTARLFMTLRTACYPAVYWLRNKSYYEYITRKFKRKVEQANVQMTTINATE